jgi:hypothetical protein
MALEFKDIESVYRFLTPEDLYGNIRTNYSDTNFEKTDLQKLLETYVTKAVSGENIIKILESLKEKEGFGYLFNTITQMGSSSAKKLDAQYWTTWKSEKESEDIENISTIMGKGVALDEHHAAAKNAVDAPGLPSNIAVTLNVLRIPLVTPARKNVDEIETFLNSVPSHFASNMVPYFDLEFQVPELLAAKDNEEKPNKYAFLNRPSLLRFLDGSIDLKNIPLTEADKSLMQISPSPSFSGDESKSYFTGMELFTTPQTLTNMDKLGISGDRINEVKPFLPMGTITGATIQIVNAGTNQFAHKTAKVEMKIHDKARLVEFSEFVRNTEFNDIIIWLTYGWVAPRSNGSNDAYAKFINENMLVREAFQTKNSSFSFDPQGQVTISLDLVSKSFSQIEKSTIFFRPSPTDKNPQGAGLILDNVVKSAKELIDRIKKNQETLDKPEGFNKEIRIFQLIEGAASGDMQLHDMVEQDAKKIIDDAEKKGPPPGVESSKFNDLISDLRRLFLSDGSVDGIGIPAGQKLTMHEKIKAASDNLAREKMEICSSNSSPDPFLPSEEKQKKFPKAFYRSSLFEEMNKYSGKVTAQGFEVNAKGMDKRAILAQSFGSGKFNGKKKIVTFGKIFSVFCLDPLIAAAQNQKISEVQVNFYGINDHCGPVSGCSIAEFPIDVQIFVDQFADLVLERGGDNMSIQDFLQFVISSQVSDPRAVGYGMRSFYEPYDANNDELKTKGNDTQASANISGWFSKYGDFKSPEIAMKIEVLEEDDSSNSKVDLLNKLQNSSAVLYQDPVSITGKKLIKKIHIYDKQLNPYKEAARLFRANDSRDGWVTVDKEALDELKSEAEMARAKLESTVKSAQEKQKIKLDVTEDAKNPNKITYTISNAGDKVAGGQVDIKAGVVGGRDALRDYVGNSLPTILYGANGTMVMQASLSSKADGLLGTIHMQGGSFRARSTLSPNGTAMADHKLPMRVIPAQLQMTTRGCPLVDLGQVFFVDFGTGTTLDNLYTITQVSHSLTPGKFETAMTFVFTDGYGKFFGAGGLGTILQELKDAVAPTV